jgi:hypothetical protein
MNRMQLKQEARARQGTDLTFAGRSLHIPGSPAQVEFETGSEGLVHLAIDEATGEKFRIKCFWDPHQRRRERSQQLTKLKLADLRKTKADALGGAPFGMLDDLGLCTPFAVVMKNVRGENWTKLRARIEADAHYPATWWPSLAIRATWGYGLATAIMKMESLGFVHADVSPGNVVLNDGLHGGSDIRNGKLVDTCENDEAGDMAMVDFDRYCKSSEDVPEPGQGWKGYAAPEIWNKQVPRVGSDRVGMAILIQEFFVIGDPGISKTEAFDWSYDQETRSFLCTFNGDAEPVQVDCHPLLDRKYPAVARLVRQTVRASTPEERPAPQAWRTFMREIIEPTTAPAKCPQSLLVESHPFKESGPRIAFSPANEALDLSTTGFHIRASLARTPDGSVYVVVHDGATLKVQLPETFEFTQYSGGDRVVANIGTILVDDQAAVNARISRAR